LALILLIRIRFDRIKLQLIYYKLDLIKEIKMSLSKQKSSKQISTCLIGLVSILALSPAISNAAAQAPIINSCFDVFYSGNNEGLKRRLTILDAKLKVIPGAQISLTLKNELRNYRGTYKWLSIKSNRLVIDFNEGFSVPLPPETSDFQIFPILPASAVNDGSTSGDPTRRHPVAKKNKFSQSPAVLLASFSRDIAKMMFGLKKRITETPRITLYGSLLSSKEAALTIAQHLQSFDDKLTAMGFELPNKTYIYVNDRPRTLPGVGPFAINGSLWSPWRGSSDASIHLRAADHEVQIVSNPKALFHERAHTMLRFQYEPKAFFNLPHATAIQEGITDFLAAHALNNATVKDSDTYNRSLVRASVNEEQSDFALTRQEFRIGDSHYNSLAYSSVLWHLRESLGEVRLSQDIKPILDSFARSQGPYPGFFADDPLELENATFQYFLATLKRYYAGNSQAEVVLREACKANLLSFSKLDSSFAARFLRFNVDTQGQRQTNVPIPVATSALASGATYAAVSGVANSAIFYLILNNF
jgi:hypothetical protein